MKVVNSAMWGLDIAVLATYTTNMGERLGRLSAGVEPSPRSWKELFVPSSSKAGRGRPLSGRNADRLVSG